MRSSLWKYVSLLVALAAYCSGDDPSVSEKRPFQNSTYLVEVIKEDTKERVAVGTLVSPTRVLTLAKPLVLDPSRYAVNQQVKERKKRFLITAKVLSITVIEASTLAKPRMNLNVALLTISTNPRRRLRSSRLLPSSYVNLWSVENEYEKEKLEKWILVKQLREQDELIALGLRPPRIPVNLLSAAEKLVLLQKMQDEERYLALKASLDLFPVPSPSDLFLMNRMRKLHPAPKKLIGAPCKKATVLGWKQSATVDLLGARKCAEQFNIQLNEGQFCSLNAENLFCDANQQGSPVMCGNFQVGILIPGRYCNGTDNGPPGEPLQFSPIAHYMDGITKAMKPRNNEIPPSNDEPTLTTYSEGICLKPYTNIFVLLLIAKLL
ncbi:unnamed protein product [Ceutorhynchus assimilis]|uniref:Peptidase S1 domain-containing protein n=1 Tax=Ceutorhynchus assimilis TaxID=467358 RepID=A0A9N9MYR2_9CUCU|nr:unnamed protein product [Ceutorhynchus assimilis]